MSNSEARRRDTKATQAANLIMRTGEAEFAKKTILAIMEDEAKLAAAPFPPHVAPEKQFYMCSALVEKSDARGHRAAIYYAENEYVALGVFVSQIMTTGWSLASYSCKPADEVNKLFKDRQ